MKEAVAKKIFGDMLEAFWLNIKDAICRQNVKTVI